MSSKPQPTRLIRFPRLPRRVRRSAFTLIELLIVIAIIGVLATMSVSLLASAAEDSKVSSTRARITQINAILQLQMEDYEVRRLPIPNRVLARYVASNPMGTMPPLVQLKYLRRQLMLALIESEMPRPRRVADPDGPITYSGNLAAGKFPSGVDLSINDLDTDQQLGTPSNSFSGWIEDNYENVPVGLVELHTLLERFPSGVAQKWQSLASGGRNNVDTPELYPAEFLYEILRSIQIDGQSAVELLGGSSIANDDGDDFPEVVDAWGEPMFFDIEQPLADGTAMATGRIVDHVSGSTISLDPRQPRALGDLRFVVGSARIPETLPAAERSKRGPN